MYFRIYHTIQQMMSDRGYAVDSSRLEISRDKFSKIFAGNPHNLNECYSNNDGERILTYFDAIERLDSKTIQTIIKHMDEAGVNRTIVVGPEGILTPTAARNLDNCRSSGKTIEFFSFDEVIINITEHELVPKHEVLTEEEKQEVLKRYNVTETQLPRILRTDPVARYLGVRPGQLLKITRNSDTAGQYVTYRLVY